MAIVCGIALLTSTRAHVFACAMQKLVSAEEHALAVARKEMGEQLAAREALIQSLATNLLLLKSGRSHAAHDSSSINNCDATAATGTPLDSGVVRMLLAELQKRPHPNEGNGTPANPPSRRRSLSAEGLDSMAFHYRSRSESTSGAAGRPADERVLLEAQERIRQLEHEVQQQAAMLEQARQESQENKQVAAARLQAMTRKESSLLAVIATLEVQKIVSCSPCCSIVWITLVLIGSCVVGRRLYLCSGEWSI